jgi:hypothetical protein
MSLGSFYNITLAVVQIQQYSSILLIKRKLLMEEDIYVAAK